MAKKFHEIKLWPDGAPDSNGLSGAETGDIECTGNISEAVMSVYLPEDNIKRRPAVLLLSGGGYGVVCLKNEGFAMADWLTSHGMVAVVLKYRLPNGNHTVPANDARRAMKLIRFHADDWNVDAKKVGVWGFSAGGHLAATIATAPNGHSIHIGDEIEQYNNKPDFIILFYPVITFEKKYTHMGTKNNLLGSERDNSRLIAQYSQENNVNKNISPVFLLHCSDDSEVSVENSLRFYKSLVVNDVLTEMVIFEQGGHGPNAFNSNPSWKMVLFDWLKLCNII